ncbi:MAG: hypothetical protein ACREP9_15200, partial [Candidatus Dormibacteraceae bacterium]
PRRRSRRGAAKTGDSAPQTDTAEGSSTPPPLLPQKGGGIYGIEESEPDSGRSRQLGEPVG